MRTEAPRGRPQIQLATVIGAAAKRIAATTIVVNIQRVIGAVGFHPQLDAVTTIVVAIP